MTPLWRRPILIGGLGLTAGAWIFNVLDPTATDFADSAVWGIAALGSGIWLLNQRRQAVVQFPATITVDRSTVERALAKVETRIQQLETERQVPGVQATETEAIVQQLRQRLTGLTTDLERQDFHLALMGGRSVGKTALLDRLSTTLPAQTTSTVYQTTALVDQTTGSSQTLSSTAETADLVLFVTTGDLTDSEYKTIEHLVRHNHRVLLVFNKQDQYLPADRPLILQQLRDRMQGLLATDDVVAVSTQPAPVIVRQQQADGSLLERLERTEPDLVMLHQRLADVTAKQTAQLILATVLRQTKTLNTDIQLQLNQLRRARSLPIIEQYQWIAATAAFANPVPSLDLVATASVTAQLIVDLGSIYHQTFSLEQAKTVMGNLATQMVKLGLVEMASQAIAPLLKSHALTYVAGGLLQGVSAAYLTRLAGLTLMEYFEEQNQALGDDVPISLSVDRLVQRLKLVLQDNQRAAFLQNLVMQGISRFVPKSSPSAT